MLAVPAFGQVEGEVAAAVAGGAGGDGDQVAADGRGPGLREGGLARAPAARSRLCAMAAMDSQAAFAAKPRWHVSQRAAGDVGEDLLHDGVVTVLAFGLDQLERGIGEDRVVAPDREQLVLPGGRLLVQVPDPADDQPGGDRLAFLRANAVYRISATSASETQAPSWSSQIARG